MKKLTKKEMPLKTLRSIHFLVKDLRMFAAPSDVRIFHAQRDEKGEFIRDNHGNVKTLEEI